MALKQENKIVLLYGFSMAYPFNKYLQSVIHKKPLNSNTSTQDELKTDKISVSPEAHPVDSSQNRGLQKSLKFVYKKVLKSKALGNMNEETLGK